MALPHPRWAALRQVQVCSCGSAAAHGGGVRKRHRRCLGCRAGATRPHRPLRRLPGHPVACRRSSRVRRLCRGQEIADGLRRSDRGRSCDDEGAGGTDAGDLVARRFARRLRRPPVRSSRGLDSGPDDRPGVAYRGSRGRTHRLPAIAARRDRDRASIRGCRHRVGRVRAGARPRDVRGRRPCRGMGRGGAISRRAHGRIPSQRGRTLGPRRDRGRDRRDAHARHRPPGRMGPPRGVVLHRRRAPSRGSGDQRLALCRLARATGRRPGRTAGAHRPRRTRSHAALRRPRRSQCVPHAHHGGPGAGDRRGAHRCLAGGFHERLPAFVAPRRRVAGVHHLLLATHPHAHRLRPGRP